MPQPNLRGDAIALAGANSASTLFLNHVGNDIPSGHDGIAQVAGAQAIPIYEGISEVAAVEGCFIQGNSCEVGTFKRDSVHTNFHQVSSLKVSPLQTGISHSGTVQVGSTEVGIIQLDLFQDDIQQVGTTKVGIAEIDTFSNGQRTDQHY